MVKFCLHLILLIVLMTWARAGYTQSDSVARHRCVERVVETKSILKDSLTLIPSSIEITTSTDTLDTQFYSIKNNVLLLNENGMNLYYGDTLFIQYQTLGVNLEKPFYMLDSLALAQSDDVIKTGYAYQLSGDKQNLFGNNDLAYDGSFSRGFSFGNRQSLVLNSNFNLQMSGNIGDDIELAAALTDANIPIQAEGNTYQLNEFDRVFISLQKNQHKLTAGDLEIRNPDSYFPRYQKKLKGLRYTDQFDFKKNSQLNTDASYAISRGKFSRNELKTQESNQGPYKLVGNAGESFLIVLSGTEKVYFDGVPLKRGSDFDYVIDYNLAEIRFTYNRLITKDSRIIVEFEYVDQSYLRSMQTLSLNYKSNRSEYYFNLYNEQDSKNAIGNASLDSLDIEVLRATGDDLQSAARSGIRPWQANADQNDVILYKKVFEPAISDSILVYSTEAGNYLYTAYFSDVGELQGSYDIKEESTVNGRVYEYVGKGNGRYEPTVRLVAPERKQLITIGQIYKWNDSNKVHAEFSLSNNDLNRFSNLDDKDNSGAAAMIHFQNAQKWTAERDSSQKNEWKTSLKYEYTHPQFQALNPYRSAEFNRDWNLNYTQQNSAEHLIHSQMALKYQAFNIHYGFDGFFRPDQFNGYKHSPKIEFQSPHTSVKLSGNFLLSNSQDYTTRFFRPQVEFQQKLKKLGESTLGFHFNQEYNRIFQKDSIFLEANSFYFNNYRWYVNTPAKSKFPLQFYFNLRKDYQPSKQEFIPNFLSMDTGLKGKWIIEKKSNLSYSLTYRQLKIDSLFNGQNIKPGTTLLGKISHNMKLYRQFIVTNTQIDLNSGQEAKAEYIFIELTNPGEGNYIWIDSNGDGIPQKGEFEEAPFSDEANYIKIIQYNNEFVRVNNAMFSHTFRLNPKNLFDSSKSKTWQKEVSKWSVIGSIRLQEKTMDDQDGRFTVPFFSEREDTSVVVLNNSRNITLYYNKLSPRYDVQLNHKANLARNLQLDGLIELGRRANTLRMRYSFQKSLDWITMGSLGSKNYRAALYPTKDYDFDFYEFNNAIKYRISKKTGVDVNYTFVHKKNQSINAEELSGHKFNGTLKLRNWYQMNIQLGLEYAKLHFSGEANSSLELAMLEGLKNGNNFLWQITLTRKMNNNIDLNFRYEGRKTGEQKTVHIASMQAKARF
jgi:hypothetical protein